MCWQSSHSQTAVLKEKTAVNRNKWNVTFAKSVGTSNFVFTAANTGGFQNVFKTISVSCNGNKMTLSTMNKKWGVNIQHQMMSFSALCPFKISSGQKGDCTTYSSLVYTTLHQQLNVFSTRILIISCLTLRIPCYLFKQSQIFSVFLWNASEDSWRQALTVWRFFCETLLLNLQKDRYR